jgi:uncharacterized protein
MCRSIVRTTVAVAVLHLAAAASFAAEASDAPARPIRSLREIRQQSVVIQRWDLSCGAAALSTVLTYDNGDPVNEALIVMSILRRADPVRVRARGGFSLLDLKRFANARGYEADGYTRVKVEQLVALAPAIVPTRIGGYNHFVVFRGVREGRVLLADPAYGNRSMSIEQFEATWQKRLAFVVRKPAGGRPPRRLDPPPTAVVAPSVVRSAIAAGR